MGMLSGNCDRLERNPARRNGPSMRNNVARMLYDSLKGGDSLNAEWFWEAGMASAKEGTPLDVVIWDAVREILDQYESPSAGSAEGDGAARQPERVR